MLKLLLLARARTLGATRPARAANGWGRAAATRLARKKELEGPRATRSREAAISDYEVGKLEKQTEDDGETGRVSIGPLGGFN